MNTNQGLVKVVSEKPTANGGTVYNFCLEDGTWYGLGFKAPSFKRGDFIEFAWEARGNFKNADLNSVVVKDSAPVQDTPARTTSVASKTNQDKKDRRITMLACRKDAIAIAGIAIETGALKLGSKNKLEVLVEQVDHLATDLFYGIYGDNFPLHAVSTDTPAAGDTNDSEE